MTVAPSANAQELGAQVKVSEGPRGLSVYQGSNTRATMLFQIESGGTTREAYCIEFGVPAVFSNDAKTVKWEEFPGSNNFKTDEEARRKVNWIAANSYPAVSIDELRAKIGVSAEELPVEAAIAQTQGSIWSILSAEFEYKGLVTEDATIKGAEYKLYEYLTGSENVGRAESSTLDLSVEIDDSQARREPNGVMGPLRFKTNAAALKITTDHGTIVDAQGKEINASEIRPDMDFYVKVDESEGEAKITASAEGDVISGALVVTPKADGGHGQTLIVTHNDVVRKVEEFTIRWEGTNVSIKTSASDQRDADKVLAPEGGTIVDVVEYTGLIVGKKYIIKGELMDKETGEGTGIKAEKEFIPESPDGQVEVEFDVPEGYAGKTLVVFERAYDESGKLIAEHTDINDRAQTVRVAREGESLGS
ncbi:MAG: VaFE repeat-containing surface-anchored protein, partial [Corynebacterium sp.]|nr:VaFE repeat-containing surface-anchored protein [Corynebacterium sp.]